LKFLVDCGLNTKKAWVPPHHMADFLDIAVCECLRIKGGKWKQVLHQFILPHGWDATKKHIFWHTWVNTLWRTKTVFKLMDLPVLNILVYRPGILHLSYYTCVTCRVSLMGAYYMIVDTSSANTTMFSGKTYTLICIKVSILISWKCITIFRMKKTAYKDVIVKLFK